MRPLGRTARDNGEAKMAIEIVACAAEPADAGECFALGMNYSAGAGVAVDLIEAHKWFNIAAMRGHADGARLRREIAEQMADAEIGCAQRAARDWHKSHPQAPVAAPIMDVRAAA
jgi:TPR repeat protein